VGAKIELRNVKWDEKQGWVWCLLLGVGVGWWGCGGVFVLGGGGVGAGWGGWVGGLVFCFVFVTPKNHKKPPPTTTPPQTPKQQPTPHTPQPKNKYPTQQQPPAPNPQKTPQNKPPKNNQNPKKPTKKKNNHRPPTKNSQKTHTKKTQSFFFFFCVFLVFSVFLFNFRYFFGAEGGWVCCIFFRVDRMQGGAGQGCLSKLKD